MLRPAVTLPLLVLLAGSFFSTAPTAAAATFKLTGSLKRASGYTIHLIAKDGSSRAANVAANGKFTLKKLTAKLLRGASLQLVDGNGHYVGPVVLSGTAKRVATTFSGRLPGNLRVLDLGKLTLKRGYAKLLSNATAGTVALFGKLNVVARAGKPLGAGELGLAQTPQKLASPIRRGPEGLLSLPSAGPVDGAGDSAGSDTDLDGVPNSLDVDDDGDLIVDGSDPDAAGSDIPYSSMFLDFRSTINANVRTGLSEAATDAVIGGANVFNLATFISLSPEQAGGVTGGHIVCAEAQIYCRPNTPVAWYGGLSESTSEFRDHAWSSLLTDAGYPRMEKIFLSGGSSAIVAAIQPRVGASQFRPGDVYQAVLTGPAGEVSTRTFTLAPYFASVPALKSYDTGTGAVSVDYNAVGPLSGSVPGSSNADPIVLESSGTLTLTFWRPQRAAIRSDESGYYDWGHANYGVVIDDQQATCAGYYSNVATELTENSTALGTGGSPLFNQGADGMPLRDQANDRAADPANTLTFTIDLKGCLTHVGGTASGVKRVGLFAAGEMVTGGRSTAGQTFHVQF